MFRTAPEIMAEHIDPSSDFVEELMTLEWIAGDWLVLYGDNVTQDGMEVTDGVAYAWLSDHPGYDLTAIPLPRS